MSAEENAPLRAIFVDTSGLFSMMIQRDENYALARRIRRLAVEQKMPLVTTDYDIAEFHALLLSRVGRATALRGLLDIDRGNTLIIRVSEDDERRARQILIRYDDKDFSLTDATSFAVMERLGITEAFTFDYHVAQFGFRALGLET
jgi:predicted nucleic acid-binding protein